MMSKLADRHETFWRLHQSGCFVMPNPWDVGSARMMAASGAAALGTTSAGFAFTLGRPDGGTISRDEALKRLRFERETWVLCMDELAKENQSASAMRAIPTAASPSGSNGAAAPRGGLSMQG